MYMSNKTLEYFLLKHKKEGNENNKLASWTHGATQMFVCIHCKKKKIYIYTE